MPEPTHCYLRFTCLKNLGTLRSGFVATLRIPRGRYPPGNALSAPGTQTARTECL